MLASYKMRLLEEKENEIYNARAVVLDGRILRISYGLKVNDVIKLKQLVFEGVELCKFLQKSGLIDKYAYVNDSIKMYRIARIDTGSKKRIINRDYEITLEDIDLNPSICLTLAALQELPVKDMVDAIMLYFLKAGLRIAMI